jgi:hypothetical protein
MATTRSTGISNRESTAEESAERTAHPPIETNDSSSEDAARRTDEQSIGGERDLQMSAKAGNRSMAQKEAGSRYPDTEMPASKKVPGAFGKERQPEESRIQRIASRAHEIYEARGGQHGKALEDWLTAEREIDDEMDRSV